MKKLKGGVLLFIFLMLFWFLLTGPDKQELIFGAAVVLLITILMVGFADLFNDVRLNPKAIIFSIIYLFVFLWELIKSNLDVAFRVLHPQLPINPGIVKVKTRLKSRIGRIMLANSITLTPGTLTVETKGDDFYIHWIDVTSDDINGATEKIVSKFEHYLEVIYG